MGSVPLLVSSIGANREALSDLKTSLASDGVHLSPTGYRLLANSIELALTGLCTGKLKKDAVSGPNAVSGDAARATKKQEFYWRGFSSPNGDKSGRKAHIGGGVRTDRERGKYHSNHSYHPYAEEAVVADKLRKKCFCGRKFALFENNYSIDCFLNLLLITLFIICFVCYHCAAYQLHFLRKQLFLPPCNYLCLLMHSRNQLLLQLYTFTFYILDITMIPNVVFAIAALVITKQVRFSLTAFFQLCCIVVFAFFKCNLICSFAMVQEGVLVVNDDQHTFLSCGMPH
jgi:hypothetical protein